MATLKLGSKGSDVKTMQTQLKKIGTRPQVNVNGNFDANTEKAVRDFQKRHGLKVDGLVGPKTSKKLKDLISKPLKWTVKDTSAGLKAIQSVLAAEKKRFDAAEKTIKKMKPLPKELSLAFGEYWIERDKAYEKGEALQGTLEKIAEYKGRFDKAADRETQERTLVMAESMWSNAERINKEAGKMFDKVDGLYDAYEAVLGEAAAAA